MVCAMRFLRLPGAAGALLLVLASPAAAHKRHHHHHHKPKAVKAHLLSITECHATLRPPTRGGFRPPARAGQPLPPPIPTGGAAILGSYLQELRKGHRNSLTVAAGDL